MSPAVKPAAYFRQHYRSDLSVYSGTVVVPKHGPYWMLCGMTLGNVFEPGRPELFASAAGFLCTAYTLNLLNQGIYRYFRDDHLVWLATCPPFVDTRGCYSGHGGVTHTPNSIIRFAHDPSYIPGAMPIPLTKELLRKFGTFFIHDYLSEVRMRASFRTLTPTDLVNCLRSDASCPEFGASAL